MKPETAKKIARAVRLRRKGWGYTSIARELAITRTKARRWTKGTPRGGRVLIE